MKQKFVMPTGDIVEKDMPAFKTPYNHDTNFESERTALYCDDPSLTKQEFVEDADINNILNRFLKNGEPPPMVVPEDFLDISDRSTYFDFASATAEANARFYTLNAKTRAEFLNDPARWADEVIRATNEGDRDRLAEIGIAVNEKAPEPKAGDPPAGGSPARQPAGAALEPSKTGGGPPKPEDKSSNPPSDKGK